MEPDPKMTDDEIGEQLRGRELEEEYVRELLASLGFDPAEGFTTDSIRALETAPMEVRRKAALRTLALSDERPATGGDPPASADPPA